MHTHTCCILQDSTSRGTDIQLLCETDVRSQPQKLVQHGSSGFEEEVGIMAMPHIDAEETKACQNPSIMGPLSTRTTADFTRHVSQYAQHHEMNAMCGHRGYGLPKHQWVGMADKLEQEWH